MRSDVLGRLPQHITKLGQRRVVNDVGVSIVYPAVAVCFPGPVFEALNEVSAPTIS